MYYSISIKKGLSAYLKLPTGSSRPGVIWFVKIEGERNATVMVRSFFPTDRTDREEELALANRAEILVREKLATGWFPDADTMLEVEN
jgi:hypothetical protein